MEALPLLSGQGLVALAGSVEVLLELRRRNVVEVAVQALGVVPVHPPERGELDVLDRLPWPAARRAADQRGLVEAEHRLGQGVVERVADGADRRPRADLRKPLAVANRRELRPGVAMTAQPLVMKAAV